MKIKRYAKNVFLVLLIISNLFLVTQIWFNSNLLPHSRAVNPVYEYILKPLGNIFIKEDNTAFSQNIKKLTYPRKIVLNHANKRAVLYSNNPSYYNFLEPANELLNKIFTGKISVKTKEIVSSDDYCAVLKRNSVYFDYGNLYDFRLFSVSICGETKNTLSEDISTIRECIISLGDNVLNNATVYIKDYKSENIYKYIVDENHESYSDNLTNYFKTLQSESTLNYSFELNFHKQETGNGTLTKLVFDPLILFNLVSSTNNPVLLDEKSILNWSAIEDSASDEILSVFNINPMTMRKYTDLNNAQVFVENDATLTFYPDGCLQYQTIEGGQGLLVNKNSDKTPFDIYAATSSAVDFVYDLNTELYGDTIPELRFSTNLVETSGDGKYVIYMDLIANGLPVLQTDRTTNKESHAITIIIENGYLKHYKQTLRKYDADESIEKVSPVINAVDILIDTLDYKNDNLNILNAEKCYVDDNTDSNLISTSWKIDIENINEILTIK